MPPVNSMDYSGKDTVLDVIRKESSGFFSIVDDPANWNVQTRCTEWEVRDMVGHMIDVTEGYLSRWESARNNEPRNTAGLLVMADSLNKGAQSYRSLQREEAINRLKNDYSRMMEIFESLTADEWGNFIVTHPYMGGLPTFFYPAFHVMDYGVHTWDMRWGLGEKDRKLDERTAGVLVPYMLYALLPSTVDAASAAGLDLEFGIEVTGEWGGKWRATVKDGKFEAKPETGNFEGCKAVFTYDASDFVLTAFQRFDGGTASGDPETIDKVRKLFFRI
ncbi:MAG TPA: maleylpyruvate isomerase N-terminal domain-containing protein [Anaerolineales bacterium]|nr:maleylpyruvate isomerase N-terminal domain-containing protein [Anaerolineales bacterium]